MDGQDRMNMLPTISLQLVGGGGLKKFYNLGAW